MASRADLRPEFARRGLTPRAQGERGTCSLFAVVGLLEFALTSHGAPPERLSVEYLNWASHRTNDRRVDGSFFSDALEGLRRYGICREPLLPYAARFDPDLTPPEACRRDARERMARWRIVADWVKEWDVTTGADEPQVARIRSCIASGQPVACGLRWPRRALYEARHRLVQPPPEGVFDGHSVLLVGYADDRRLPGGGEFLFRNSRGSNWREAGHARMSYAYARAFANDAVAVRADG